MRRIRRSQTYLREFHALLEQGFAKFGFEVVAAKQRLVGEFVAFLARHPGAGLLDPDIGLRVSPISKTPFALAYDFDDSELRVHFIFHQHADRTTIKPNTVDW